ncbi:hypothetical protein JW992_00465 [candidate division KSB1 bacterium]|nr:hypothetical protein [candidate division KSB1 bacterium]
MKTKSILTALMLVGLVGAGTGIAQNKVYSQETWDLFCKQLALNLESQNTGVRNSAMQHISHYSMFPEFALCDKAIKKLIAIVGDSKEPTNVRILAVSALYNTGDPRGIEFFAKQLQCEKNPLICHLCRAALYHSAEGRDKYDQGTSLIADLGNSSR